MTDASDDLPSDPAGDAPAAGYADGDTGVAPPDGAGSSRTRVAMVAGVVLLLVALAVPLALRGSDDGGELQPLGLSPAGVGAERAMGAADAALSMPASYVEYRIGGDLPDLGSTAPVWQAVDAGVDEAWVASAAAALEVPGEVAPFDRAAPALGWQVGDGRLTVTSSDPLAQVSYWSGDAAAGVSSSSVGCAEPGVAVEPMPAMGTVAEGDETAEGAVPGAVGGDAPIDATGTDVVDDIDGGAAVTCTSEVVEVVEPPCCAPSDAEAEAIATDLLAELGVPGEWEATSTVGQARFAAVGCAVGEECPEPQPPTDDEVFTRSVTLVRLVDGQVAAGLEWYVEVGAEGVVTSASGPVVELELLGDYPLRPTTETVQALVDGDPSAVPAPTTGGYALLGGGPVPLGAPEAMSSSAVAVDASGDAGVSISGKTATAGGAGTGGTERSATTMAPDVVGTAPAAPSPGAPDGPTSTVVCVTDPCPGDDGVVPDPGVPYGCVTEPDGATSCVGSLGEGCEVVPDGAVACVGEPPVAVDPMPVEPEPMPYVEPEPIVVTITGASLARAVMVGTASDGSPAVYVVPVYDLDATTADGQPWPVALVAVSPELVGSPTDEVPAPEPMDEETTTSVPTTSVVGPEGPAPTADTVPVDPYPGPTVVDPAPDGTIEPCDVAGTCTPGSSGGGSSGSSGSSGGAGPVTTVPVTTVP